MMTKTKISNEDHKILYNQDQQIHRVKREKYDRNHMKRISWRVEANLQPRTSTLSNTPPEPYISSNSSATLTSNNNVMVMNRHEPTVVAVDPAILAILPASADAIGGSTTVSSSSATSSAEADDDRGEEGACAKLQVQYRYPLMFLLKLKDAPLSQAKPTALLATSGSGISGTSTAPSLLLSCFIDAPGQSPGETQQTSRWSSNSGGRGGNNNDRGDRDRDTGRGGRGGDRSDGGRGGGGGERGEGAGLMTRGGGIGGLAGQDIRLEPDGYRRRPGDPQRRSFNTGCFVPVTNNSSSRRTHSPTPPGNGGTPSSGGGKLTNEQSDRTIGGSSERDRDREGGRRIGSGRILAYMDKSGGGGGGGPGQDDEGGGYSGGYNRRDGRRGGDMDRVDMDRYDRRNLFTRNNISAHPNHPSMDYDNANTSSNNSDNRPNNNNNNTNNSNHSNKSNSRTIMSNRYDPQQQQQQQQHSSYQQRGNNRRMMDVEEPEWFSSGPISQHDTIELRGFDDGDKTPKKQRQTAQAQKKKPTGTMSNNSSNSVANNRNSTVSTSSTTTGKENESSSANTKADVDRSIVSSGNVDKEQRGSPNSQKGQFSDDKKVSSGPADREIAGSSSNLVHNDDLNNSFNLDEILKLDMPDVLANGVESVGGSTTSASRFSRWFQQNKSPPPRIDSPQHHHQVADDYLRSLMTDADNQHGGIGTMLLNQQTFPNMQQQQNMSAFPQTDQALHITAPGDSASYFAPISPASTAGIHQQQHNYQQQQQQQQQQMPNQHYQQQQHHQQQQANMLADMLQGRGNSGSGTDVRRSVLGVATPPGSKVFSLEELEGNIKGAAAMMMSQQQQQQKHAMHHRAQHQHVATAQQQQPPPPPQQNNQQQSKGGEDVDAFKRMMEQAGHALTNGPLTNSSNQQNASTSNNMNNNARNSKPPPTLMELLAQSQSSAQSAANPQLEISQQHFPTTSHYATKQQQQQQQQQIEFHMKQQQQQLLNSMIYNSQQQQPGGRISPDMRNACREIVQRPETQALLQGLKRGEISTAQIYQQLNTPTLQARQRDALQIALKLHTSSTTSTTPQSGMTQPQPATNQPAQHPVVSQQPPVIGAGAGRDGAILTSPGGGASPQPHHMQQGQVMWNQQLRLSPLPPQGVNPFCVSPILPTSPNTLGVPALHKRIPSPYELQVHTQNIMQRALIKKKLEEQQENYRKKQEAAASTGTGRDLSPSTNLASSNPSATSISATALSTSSIAVSSASSVQQQSLATIASNMQQQQSHHKATASPTPTIAFTPTSVLRKMTADKDEATMAAMLNATAAKMQPGRAVIGNLRAQQQQSGNISSPWGLFHQGNKPVGRPIVKSTQNNPGSSYPGQQQQPQSTLMSNQQQQEQFFQQQQRLLQQQQQQHKWNQFYSQQQQNQQQQQQMFMNAGQQQMTPQQLRAQQQNIRAQHQHQQGGGNQQGQGGSQQQQGQQGWAAVFADSNHQHHRVQHQQQSNHQATVLGRDNNPAGGDLSPTSNQLAKWFSPDLLERARNGKCPVLPNPALAKRALNLEDVEQQRRRNSASITGGGGHTAAGDN